MIVLQAVDRRTFFGAIFLDVLLTEEIDFSSEVTKYPTENGVMISDHITQGVETIKISGMISTADVVGGFSNAAAFGFGVDNSPKLIDVIEGLRQIHEARDLVTVSTGQMIYDQMGFTSLTARRSSNGDGGNWLEVNAELTKIRKVNLKTADVPAPEVAAAPATGRAGRTATPAGRSTPASTQTSGTSASYAAQINDGARGVQGVGGAGQTPLAGATRSILGAFGR